MITLYDFDSKAGRPWNVSVWKARYSLNFKNLPYKTVWIEFPDVEPTMKKLGALPTGTRKNGTPFYTLPAIHDDSTGAIIADSAVIAEYLDKTYPTPTQLIPSGTHALQTAFRELVDSKATPLVSLVVPDAVTKTMNPPSAEYMARVFATAVSNAASMSEETRVAEWEKAEEVLGSVKALMKPEDRWVMGDAISFADFVVAAMLIMAKTVYGKESEEWTRMMNWHDGRWDRMMTDLEKYTAVH
ncbi:hypothetical protein BDP27DRAFT_1349131 [Rhodocollybia butyracea]|uniref:GST N-terminal domain-containing protein n=1 Tax=Rhodocollybia butyracea TaxID=206335 RepID=A0A9P5TWA0_9AGAR|nr:hypothetical protein BDP27DRAFT_1349131 [Rhodocollybia butyracea]